MREPSVGLKLTLGLGVVLVLIAVIGGLGFSSMQAVADQTRRSVAMSHRTVTAVSDLQIAARNAVLTLRVSGKSGTTKDLPEAKQQEAAFDRTLRELPRTRGNVAALSRVDELFDETMAEGQAFVTATVAQRWAESGEHSKSFDRTADRLNHELEQVRAREVQRMQAKLEGLEQSVRTTGFLFGGGVVFTLVVGLVLTLAIRRSIVGPLASLTAVAATVARTGDLKTEIPVRREDEIGKLAEAFREMMGRVGEAQAGLEAMNANLEELVRARTETISVIVNNVRAGFLIVDRTLAIQPGFTRSCLDLVGEQVRAGVPFAQAAGMDERQSAQFNLGMEQVFDDFLGEELTLAQLPGRIEQGDRVLSLAGSALRKPEGEVWGVLFTLQDVTRQVLAERENQANSAILKILRQRDAFLACLGDARRLLIQAETAARAANQVSVRFALHTLKGNTATFGLADVATMIHELEDQEHITADQVSSVAGSLRGFCERFGEVLRLSFDSDPLDVFEVRADAFRALTTTLEKAKQHDEVVAACGDWLQWVQRKPVGELLGPLVESARELAVRSEKLVHVRLTGGETGVDPKFMGPVLQSLGHLLRNSIRHGIEAPHERAGKPEEADLNLDVQSTRKGWRITVRDDGRGIDVERVVAKAIELGLTTPVQVQDMAESERLELIFKSGLSTATTVDEVAGRGVGLGAVAEAVRAAGGTIHVESSRGKGTTITLTVPNPFHLSKLPGVSTSEEVLERHLSIAPWRVAPDSIPIILGAE